MRLTLMVRGGGPRKKKSPALRELEAMANREAIRLHPHCDPRYLAPRLYSDSTANALTQAIIDFLNLSGQQGERTSTTGTGADISAVVNGRALRIEVKMRDQSEAQRAYQQKIQQAGGVYLLVHSFEEFYNWYTTEATA